MGYNISKCNFELFMIKTKRKQRAYRRKSDPTRIETLLKAAELFHLRGYSKTRVAKEIGASVTQVVRLLEEVRARKMMRIEINLPQYDKLARDLRKRFPCLKEAIIVPSDRDYHEQVK